MKKEERKKNKVGFARQWKGERGKLSDKVAVRQQYALD